MRTTGTFLSLKLKSSNFGQQLFEVISSLLVRNNSGLMIFKNNAECAVQYNLSDKYLQLRLAFTRANDSGIYVPFFPSFNNYLKRYSLCDIQVGFRPSTLLCCTLSEQPTTNCLRSWQTSSGFGSAEGGPPVGIVLFTLLHPCLLAGSSAGLWAPAHVTSKGGH